MTEKNITEAKQTLGSLLRLPYQALSDRLYQKLAQTYPEVRPAHGAVFRHLLPGGSRVTELAERAQMTKQSMAYLVESLEAAGYVHLVPDPSDGRAKLVRFTAKGEQCLALALSLTAKLEAEAAARMPEGAMHQLKILLKQINTALQTGDDPAPNKRR